MAQLSRVHAALTEDLSRQLPVTPAPANVTTTSDLCQYPVTPIHTRRQIKIKKKGILKESRSGLVHLQSQHWGN